MIRIDARFNGPPTSAHGGVACGLFAGLLDAREATVRLLRPPPLDVDLEVLRDEARITVLAPDGAVATVQPLPHPFDVDALPWLAPADVAAARQFWIENVAPRHVFPTCFGCGHARPADDGLALFAGQTSVPGVCADSWTPAASEVNALGQVPPWLVWAAMDCPSGAAAVNGTNTEELAAILLGELAVRIDELPRVGTTYQVVARHAGTTGRRLLAEVGVVDDAGRNLATGRATWIGIPQS